MEPGELPKPVPSPLTSTVLRTFNRPQVQSTRAVKHPSPGQNKGAGDRVSGILVAPPGNAPGGTEGSSERCANHYSTAPSARWGRCGA